MSKRFGRNQKRKMREEIVRLKSEKAQMQITNTQLWKKFHRTEGALRNIVEHFRSVNKYSIFLDPKKTESDFGKIMPFQRPQEAIPFCGGLVEESFDIIRELIDIEIRVTDDYSIIEDTEVYLVHLFIAQSDKLVYRIDPKYVDKHGLTLIAPHITQMLVLEFDKMLKRKS